MTSGVFVDTPILMVSPVIDSPSSVSAGTANLGLALRGKEKARNV